MPDTQRPKSDELRIDCFGPAVTSDGDVIGQVRPRNRLTTGVDRHVRTTECGAMTDGHTGTTVDQGVTGKARACRGNVVGTFPRVASAGKHQIANTAQDATNRVGVVTIKLQSRTTANRGCTIVAQCAGRTASANLQGTDTNRGGAGICVGSGQRQRASTGHGQATCCTTIADHTANRA